MNILVKIPRCQPFYAVLFLPIKVCKCPRSCPYLRFKHKLAVKQRKLGLSDSLPSNNPTSGKKFRIKSAETRGNGGEGRGIEEAGAGLFEGDLAALIQDMCP